MRKTLTFALLLAIALQVGIPTSGIAQDVYGTGIQEIRIEIPFKDWDWKLDSIKNVNPESRLLATAFVNGARYDSVGVRYKGNSSYFRSRKDTSRKLPINVKLNYRMREQQLKGG